MEALPALDLGDLCGLCGEKNRRVGDPRTTESMIPEGIPPKTSVLRVIDSLNKREYDATCCDLV
jgi:hypothetical protein